MNRQQRRHRGRAQTRLAAGLRRDAERQAGSSQAVLAASHRLFEMGRMKEALPALRQAMERFADDALLRVALAYALATTGEVAAALVEYRELLRRQPDSPPLLVNLAIMLIGQGQVAEAQQLLERAAALAPDHADTNYTLAELLERQRRGREAFQHYHRAAAAFRRQIGPRPGPARCHDLVKLATALMRTGDIPRALAAFDHALKIRPDHPLALARRGLALAQLRRTPEAIESLRRAAAVEPDLGEVRRAMGDLLLEAGDVRAAEAEFRRALRIDPKDALAAYFLAAAQRRPGVAAPPAEYVRQLFDQYAARFDRHLVEVLQYRAPELLAEAVQAVARPPTAAWTIIDLGCGTGLCGPLLRPWATRLIGVDLSGGMLAKARERAVYDELSLGDLAAALGRFDGEIDLAVSADVLVYIGDLAPLFAAAARALRPGGWFAFTAEAHEGEGFVVDTTRRYRHSLAYLNTEAASAGFGVAHAETIVARYEQGQPAHEHLMLLRRPE
jgi:predicted TPR repeat methyltransferase